MSAPLHQDTIERSSFLMGMLSLPLAASTAGEPRPEHRRRDPIKVGAVLSLTGDHGDRGTEAKLALDAFQRTRRFRDGRRVTFLVADVKSDYRLVAAAAPELKERGVVAIIGPDSGREMVPAFAELKAVALPVLVGAPVPYPNFNREPFFFSPNLPQEPTQLEDLVAYIAGLGLPNPALLTTGDERGRARAQLWQARGGAAEGTRGFLWPVGAGSAHFPRHSEQAKALRTIEHAIPDVDLSRHPLIGHIWDNALALALAIQRAGSTDAEAVRDALENLGHWGVNGFNRRTPQDHVGYQRRSAIRAVVRDGSIVPV
jgi:ABC-type branched-subunit amino acid transport system substrate-binding protein